MNIDISEAIVLRHNHPSKLKLKKKLKIVPPEVFCKIYVAKKYVKI